MELFRVELLVSPGMEVKRDVWVYPTTLVDLGFTLNPSGYIRCKDLSLAWAWQLLNLGKWVRRGGLVQDTWVDCLSVGGWMQDRQGGSRARLDGGAMPVWQEKAGARRGSGR